MIIALTFTKQWKTAKAKNTAGLIFMSPDCPYRAAVWAQEAFEATQKISPINLMRYIFQRKYRRELELMGHEIKVQAAVLIYKQDEKMYRSKEAYVMSVAYSEFGGYSSSYIKNLMLERRAQARDWVNDHYKEIYKQT